MFPESQRITHTNGTAEFRQEQFCTDGLIVRGNGCWRQTG